MGKQFSSPSQAQSTADRRKNRPEQPTYRSDDGQVVKMEWSGLDQLPSAYWLGEIQRVAAEDSSDEEG